MSPTLDRTRMRALVLTSFGRLELEDRPIPEPGDDEVLVRIAATGICGSDIHGYTGENGRRVPGQVMGHESSGVVAAVGRRVTAVAPGAPVTFNPVVLPAADLAEYSGREQHHPGKTVIGVAPEVPASFADYVVVPARNVVALPEGLPLELGALVEPLAVAVHAVRRIGSVGPGARAVVIGGGPIGQSVVIALQDAGVTDITVSEVDPARRALVERLGARAIDPAARHLAEAFADEPADIALDAVGVSATLRDALSATRLGGAVCLVGMGAPRIELDAFLVSTEERTIVGSFVYSADDFAQAARAISRDPGRYRALISREVAPEAADRAFAALAAGDGTPGKVLVRFDAEPVQDSEEGGRP